MISLATLSPAALLWIGGVIGFAVGLFAAGLAIATRRAAVSAVETRKFLVTADQPFTPNKKLHDALARAGKSQFVPPRKIR